MPANSATINLTATLERNRLLAALPPAEYERLLPELEPVHLSARQLLALPDQPVSRVYFIRGAVVSLLVPMSDGSAVEGATIGNEGMVGLEAFMGDGADARLEMVTQIPGPAARIDAQLFRTLVGSSPPMQSLLHRYSLALMSQIARTSGCNRVHSVTARVARVLLMSADRVDTESFPLTHEMLAVMLGVRRASVSQAAAALQEAQVLEYRRGCMTILDRAGLKAVACEDYVLMREAYEDICGVVC
jgi:CRP-like cAMP-binding protein